MEEKISIVIPAYNEVRIIKQTLFEILEFLKTHKLNVEIIVVDDGSKDATSERAKEIQDKRIKVISYKPNQGKGHAIKTGVKEATGDLVLFLDADYSIPVDHILEFLPETKKHKVVIGSKALKTTENVKSQKKQRKILGRCFNLLVRIVTGVKFKDTQCGFKLFDAAAAKKIFPQLRTKRFSFDVEVLFLAKKYGYKVKEMPITLTDRETSRVSIVFDSLSMLKDVCMIRIRDLAGRYEK